MRSKMFGIGSMSNATRSVVAFASSPTAAAAAVAVSAVVIALFIVFPARSLASDDKSVDFFAAISKRDGATVRAMLEADPSLASAKNANGRSAVLAALFVTTDQGFTIPQKNEVLQAVLARHPELTFFEACGVGDAHRVAEFIAHDSTLARSWVPFGFSALHLAAFSGDVETARILLAHGADIQARAKSRFQNSPLQAALLPGNYEMAKFLLDNGADVLVRQSKGFAPIHEAAFLGRRDLVDLLLDDGAEIDARTNDGRTAVTEALRLKHADIADYLRSKGGSGGEITVDLMAEPK